MVIDRAGRFDKDRAMEQGIPMKFWSRLQKGEIIEEEDKTYLPEMVLGPPRKGKGQPIIDIDATIVCERDSHKGIIIGKQGSMLKKIGTNARYEIERLLQSKVNLKLWVKVKKDWRDSDFLIKNFGYKEEE